MKRIRTVTLTVMFLVLSCAALDAAIAQAVAQDEHRKDFELMAAAWQCEYLADTMGDATQRKRFFSLGYKAGRAYFESVFNAPLYKSSPSLWLDPAHGGHPIDFRLGEIYVQARAKPAALVHKKADAIDPDRTNGQYWPTVMSAAREMFREKNCEFILERE